MTGFASAEGADQDIAWTWDIRSVNARGLDLRFRLPDRAQNLEADLRKRIAAVARRGSVQVALRLKSAVASGQAALDPAALEATVAAIQSAADALNGKGLAVAPVDPARLLGLPGLASETEAAAFPAAAIMSGFDTALADFGTMRATEGAALANVVASQIAAIDTLVDTARDRAGCRDAEVTERYRTQVARLIEDAGHVVDPDRMSHDLAALIVKGDIAEELDRLGAHIDAARALLTADGPIGRKFDFLMQEFNREANTLCAKSADSELTQAGLDLKVVIDQMREQIQNLE
ncbi:MAG: YicC/YloC family endoribonuclease [Pseudomonadota bacterium]